VFRYIPEHFHHIMFELLKNSMRAVVELHGHMHRSLPPIEVVISDGEHDIAIKVSDTGGGIRRKDLQKIWYYSYSTFAPEILEENLRNLDSSSPSQMLDPSVDGLDPLVKSPMGGFGYGLPLSRLYARCFGGDLILIPMDGYGTDAYLYLSKLGDSDGVVFDT